MPILVEPVITLRPVGRVTVEHFIDVYANKEHALIERHGFDLLGAWTRMGGPIQQIVHLYRFESLTAYDDARSTLRKDPAVVANLLAAYGENLSITETVTCGASLPHATADRSDRLKTASPPAELYVQALLQVALRDQATAVNLMAEVHDQVEASGAMQLVTAYMPIFGRRDQLSVVWRLPQGMASLAAAAEAASGEAVEALRALVQDESLQFLNPLPYSPLQ